MSEAIQGEGSLHLPYETQPGVVGPPPGNIRVLLEFYGVGSGEGDGLTRLIERLASPGDAILPQCPAEPVRGLNVAARN